MTIIGFRGWLCSFPSARLILFLAVCAAFGCGRQQSPTTLGVIQPLTGELGSFGESVVEGVRLAVEDHNMARADMPVKMIVEDSQASPKIALNALLKLADVDHAHVVIGPLTSGEALTLLPTVSSRGILLISPTASSPALSGASPNFFRVWPSDTEDGQIAPAYATNYLSRKRAAVLYVNNDFGLGLAKVFQDVFSKLGGTVVSVDGYSETNTDFRTILRVLAAKSVDMVFLPGYPRGIATILRQAQDLAFRPVFFSNVAAEDKDFVNVAGAAARGLYFSAPTLDLNSKDPLIVSFRARYKQRTNIEPDAHAARGYDAAFAALSAFRAHRMSGDELRTFLLNTSSFESVSGPFRFNSRGDIVASIAIKQYSPESVAMQLGVYDPTTGQFHPSQH